MTTLWRWFLFLAEVGAYNAGLLWGAIFLVVYVRSFDFCQVLVTAEKWEAIFVSAALNAVLMPLDLGVVVVVNRALPAFVHFIQKI